MNYYRETTSMTELSTTQWQSKGRSQSLQKETMWPVYKSLNSVGLSSSLIIAPILLIGTLLDLFIFLIYQDLYPLSHQASLNISFASPISSKVSLPHPL